MVWSLGDKRGREGEEGEIHYTDSKAAFWLQEALAPHWRGARGTSLGLGKVSFPKAWLRAGGRELLTLPPRGPQFSGEERSWRQPFSSREPRWLVVEEVGHRWRGVQREASPLLLCLW